MVAEEGVPLREIAEAIGKGLKCASTDRHREYCRNPGALGGGSLASQLQQIRTVLAP